MEGKGSEEPSIVYHYTDGAGLLGIIEKKQIWCTHVNHLNDAQEHKINRVLYGEMLADICARRLEAPAEVMKVAQVALSRIDRKMGPPDDEISDHFVACFSSVHDSLNQWRGYSRSGTKFCIGFNFGALKKAAKASGLEFGQLNYDNDSVRQEMHRRFCAEAKALWDNHAGGDYHPGVPANWHPPYIHHISRRVMYYASPLLKHSSFESEAEHRMYTPTTSWHQILSSKSMLFRPGKAALIPYLAIPLISGEEPTIASITVGPTPCSEESIASVEMLAIRETGLLNPLLGGARPQIHLSRVPYRDWN
jgi:hypothetical protein